MGDGAREAEVVLGGNILNRCLDLAGLCRSVWGRLGVWELFGLGAPLCTNALFLSLFNHVGIVLCF